MPRVSQERRHVEALFFVAGLCGIRPVSVGLASLPCEAASETVYKRPSLENFRCECYAAVPPCCYPLNSRSGFSSLISRFGEFDHAGPWAVLDPALLQSVVSTRIKKCHVGDRLSLQLSHWFGKPRNDCDLTGLAAPLANTIAEHPLGHLLNGQRLALHSIHNPSKPGSRYHGGLRLFQPLEVRCEPAVSNMMRLPRRLRMRPLKAFAVCKLSETVPHARCR